MLTQTHPDTSNHRQAGRKEVELRIAEIVGANVQRGRERLGISQAELGRRMKPYIGKQGWTRQAVSAAEKGGRAFTAEELVALSEVLEMPITALFVVVGEDVTVELSGGHQLPDVDLLRMFIAPARVQIDNLRLLLDALGSVRDVTTLLSEGTDQQMRYLDQLDRMITAILEEKGSQSKEESP